MRKRDIQHTTPANRNVFYDLGFDQAEARGLAMRAELMAALRAQRQLSHHAGQGKQQSYQGHDEVDAGKVQLASLMKGTLPGDLAAQAKTLDESLTKIGGVIPPSGAPFRRPNPDPNALKSFLALNDDYSTMVSMMQVGLDIGPTPAQFDNWQSVCSSYNRTVAAWKAAEPQIAGFNAALVKNQLQPLNIAPSKLTDSPCSVLSPARTNRTKHPN